MNDFFKKLIKEKVETEDYKFKLIASTLKVEQVRQSEMFIIFNSSDESAIDIALNALAVIQHRNTPLRKDAVDYMFSKVLSFDKITDIDEKGLLLAEEALKYGFEPHSDGLTHHTYTIPQDRQELSEIINKLCSVIDVAPDKIAIKSEKIKDFEFRYYSFFDVSDLENLHDNNMIIDERSIYNTETKKQFQFLVSEKQKKVNAQFYKNKNNELKR